jgi:hypothetical protein
VSRMETCVGCRDRHGFFQGLRATMPTARTPCSVWSHQRMQSRSFSSLIPLADFAHVCDDAPAQHFPADVYVLQVTSQGRLALAYILGAEAPSDSERTTGMPHPCSLQYLRCDPGRPGRGIINSMDLPEMRCTQPGRLPVLSPIICSVMTRPLVPVMAGLCRRIVCHSQDALVRLLSNF